MYKSGMMFLLLSLQSFRDLSRCILCFEEKVKESLVMDMSTTNTYYTSNFEINFGVTDVTYSTKVFFK